MAKYQDLVSEEDWLLAVDGRAWVFGDRVCRSEMLRDDELAMPAEQAAYRLLAGLDPSFAASVQPGDFLVAGTDFGADVTQRVIPAAMAHLGIAAVIARSFGHFFCKNAIHIGLPALVIEESAAIRSGDRLRVDVEAHVVANKSSGDRYVVRNLSDEEIAILRAGDLVAYTRQQREKKR